MQIRDNPGPKQVPLARRRGGAGLGGWIGGPASTAGHNRDGEAAPPQSRSEPHQTCAFATRFPYVLETLKAEGAIYARDPATQHLVLENGKAQILDVTAFSMVDWLLKENGDGAAPSVGNSMYACYFMLQKRIGCRAQQESASFLKRHFSKTTAYTPGHAWCTNPTSSPPRTSSR